MRLALKLSVLLALASTGPLLLAMSFTLPKSREVLRRQVQEFHLQTAELLAREVNAAVLEQLEALTLASTALRFGELEPEEQQEALRLIYRQSKGVNLVGLYDEAGEAVVPEVYLRDPEASGLKGHAPMTDEGLATYAQNVPLAAAFKAGVAVGPVYLVPEAGGGMGPRVVTAMALGTGEERRWVLALELSLQTVLERIAQYRFGQTGRAFLVDSQGLVMAHADPARVGKREEQAAVQAGLKGTEAQLGAVATVPLMGWAVGVEQESGEALRAVEREALRGTVWILVGLVVALGLGLVAVRAVTRPLNRLQAVAHRVAEGDLQAEVPIRGKDELAELGDAFNQMTRGLRERERLRESFQRYVSDEIAQRILKEQSDLDVKGELSEVTVLFVDVRGFTSMAERHEPQEVIQLLNLYFEQVVKVVIRRGGVINKFLGDGVLAVFGLKKHNAEAMQAAVQAGIEIQRRVKRFNQSRASAGLETIMLGIGINTGRVIAGNVGAAERMEYTVIGDAVNVAQRIQTHATDGEVLLSADTVVALGPGFEVENWGTVQVKGRDRPVEMYRAVVDGQRRRAGAV